MIHIHIKWILVIVFTITYLTYIIYKGSERTTGYASIGPLFEWGAATLLYMIFWIVWLIIW